MTTLEITTTTGACIGCDYPNLEWTCNNCLVNHWVNTGLDVDVMYNAMEQIHGSYVASQIQEDIERIGAIYGDSAIGYIPE